MGIRKGPPNPKPEPPERPKYDIGMTVGEERVFRRSIEDFIAQLISDYQEKTKYTVIDMNIKFLSFYEQGGGEERYAVKPDIELIIK